MSQINASPQKTMALLSDASRWPTWYPGMTEIDIAPPFPEEGGKVGVQGEVGGACRWRSPRRFLDYQPEKLHVFQMGGMLSGRARWELTPEGDGTRLTTTFPTTRLPGRWLSARSPMRSNGQAHEREESRRSSQQLQSARRAAVSPRVGYQPEGRLCPCARPSLPRHV